MAVVVSIARGHDASYPFKTIGSADGATVRGERGAGYYLSAVEKGGEPAGTWIGHGAAGLGLKDNDTVRREDFEPLCGQFLDPRDPSHQTHLGRPPRVNAELAALYQAKLAANPGATADERMRLLTEARAEYDGPVGVQYFDTTFSVDKTISLAHASALASALEARQAGDHRAAADWEARAAGIWAEIEHSVRLYIAHMQAQVCTVRTGHHGRRIGGTETGRFEDAGQIPVAIFPQHTSRNGDPQLHVHILWLNRVRTIRDEQWRAIDSRALYREKGAAAALAAFALESGLTRRFGFGWAYRPASKGRVIAGFDEKVITQFSSRRAQISKTTLALADAYERDRDHPPDQRALASMRQFANARTRRGKESGALDFTHLLRDWEHTSREAETGSLRELASRIWPASTAERLRRQLASRGDLTSDQEHAAMAAGLAQVQEESAAWHRGDLLRCIAQHLPDNAAGRDQEHAWQILDDLADRALAGHAGEAVLRLDAPEWPRVPYSLRRADGESIYRPPGGQLYATRSQLTLEQQLIAQAREHGAPHLAADTAARLLGSDRAQLENALHTLAAFPDECKVLDLRLDQTAAAFLALTSPRRVELIVGPAGTGKTYTAARIAAAWRAAGRGRVVGIATTSAGRNVLTDAGIETAANTAQFLGHLPGRPSARGVQDLGPDALLILDEASMTSMADLAAITRHAAVCGAKVVITGDHAQLEAISSGGGMAVVARALGYAQLTEPERFAQQWERGASLALRAGSLAALGQYDQQGRLHGGSYEDMAEQAARAYLAEHLAGRDVMLTAARRSECLDLGRRIQGYLLDWDQLKPGATAELRDDTRAYAGDLVIARENDNSLEAGAPGRTLANGDLLRVEAITRDQVTVRRLTGHDEQTSQHTWSRPFTISRAYAAASCDLGYALTVHTVEGRTVGTGITLASDAQSRSSLYVAMTRGRDRNDVYAYPAGTGDSRLGGMSDPDAEVNLQRDLLVYRDGFDAPVGSDSRDPVAILASVIRRDDSQMSAIETREQALSDADHLAVLHAIWQDQCRAETAGRYARAVRQAASHADAGAILKDTDALWRTVRSAEFAGLDGEQVLRTAITGRPFTGARSLSAVLDARIRREHGSRPPAEAALWSECVPRVPDRELSGYLAELAAAMDARQQRISEHAAEQQPTWAVRALGEVPADPSGRAEWTSRAGRLAAYREITGYDDPWEAIGPEPASTSPEARALWHRAFAGLDRVSGVDVRGLTDGQLLARRRAFETETSWAPVFVAEELRAATRQEQLSRIENTRHRHEPAAAGRQGGHELAALHAKAADSWAALGHRAAQVREQLAIAHDTRCQWEALTEPARRLARAADVELKRRGVLSADEELRSFEPAGFAYPADADVWVQPRLDGGIDRPAEPKLAGPADREQQALQILGLTLDYEQRELPAEISKVAAYNRQRQAEVDRRRNERDDSELEDRLSGTSAWDLAARGRSRPIIQPPKPPVPPSDRILELAADREAER